MSNKSREHILGKVRQALKQKAVLPNPSYSDVVFKKIKEDKVATFKENFLATKGQLYNVSDIKEASTLINKLAIELRWNQIFAEEDICTEILKNGGTAFESDIEQIQNANVGLTTCNSLIARTGSMVIDSSTKSGRVLSVFPHIHVVIAFQSQIVRDIENGLDNYYKNEVWPSMVSLTTGPSRTADIEKTLVLGAHGPKELFLILIENDVA